MSHPNLPNIDIPDAKPLPEKMEITVDLHMRDPRPAAPAQLVNTRLLVEEMLKLYAKVMLEPHSDEETIRLMKVSYQLLSHRFGALPSLKLLRRPDNAERLAIPGVESLFRGVPLLMRDIPSALEGIDLNQIDRHKNRLLHVREAIEATEIFYTSLRALESHLEHGVVNPCWTVTERIESMTRTNGEIGRVLATMLELCGGHTAKEAAETKKKTDRARDQGAEKAKAAYEAKEKETDSAKAKDEEKDESKSDPETRRRKG